MPNTNSKKTLVTTPDNALGKKIGKEVDLNTVFTEDRIQASEAEVVKVQESFLDNVAHKLEDMRNAFTKDPGSDLTKETLMSQSFIIKGQAESLDYSLLSHIAKSLCDYGETHLSHDNAHREVIVGKHLDTMQVIIKGRIKGDGDALGPQLIDTLKLLIAKYHG